MSSQNPKVSRRTLFAGAGTVGVVAAATSLLPQVQDLAPQAIRARQALLQDHFGLSPFSNTHLFWRVSCC
jgi:hypothetical protein